MLHEIGVELGAALAAKGCPLKVVDGPEATGSTTFARERIVIEHDDGDAFRGALSQRNTPRYHYVRDIAGKLTIYAQSPAAGATHWEHRRRAEHVLDLVLVALDLVAANRKNQWKPKSGRFLLPADLAASETAGGVAYELTFTYERGVFEQKWSGAVAPTTAVGGDDGLTIGSTTKVSLAHGSGDPPEETGCGG